MNRRAAISWEILFALAGLAICLIPTLPHTTGFWHFNRAWTSLQPDRFHVSDVTPESPADLAGLKSGDWVMGLSGEADLKPLQVRLDRLKPGETLKLPIERNGELLEITATGAKPVLEAIYVYDAQLAMLFAFGALLVFFYATGPRRQATWRMLVTIVAGFALSISMVLAYVVPALRWNIFATTQLVCWLPITSTPSFPMLLQQSVCMAVGLGLIAIGATQLRRKLTESPA